jgi:hypothetical protein
VLRLNAKANQQAPTTETRPQAAFFYFSAKIPLVNNQ